MTAPLAFIMIPEHYLEQIAALHRGNRRVRGAYLKAVLRGAPFAKYFYVVSVGQS